MQAERAATAQQRNREDRSRLAGRLQDPVESVPLPHSGLAVQQSLGRGSSRERRVYRHAKVRGVEIYPEGRLAQDKNAFYSQESSRNTDQNEDRRFLRTTRQKRNMAERFHLVRCSVRKGRDSVSLDELRRRGGQASGAGSCVDAVSVQGRARLAAGRQSHAQDSCVHHQRACHQRQPALRARYPPATHLRTHFRGWRRVAHLRSRRTAQPRHNISCS